MAHNCKFASKFKLKNLLYHHTSSMVCIRTMTVTITIIKHETKTKQVAKHAKRLIHNERAGKNLVHLNMHKIPPLIWYREHKRFFPLCFVRLYPRYNIHFDIVTEYIFGTVITDVIISACVLALFHYLVYVSWNIHICVMLKRTNFDWGYFSNCMCSKISLPNEYNTHSIDNLKTLIRMV